MTNEMRELFDNYLREHLSINITTGHSYSYSGNRVKVELLLDGEIISYEEARLPEEGQ